MNQKFELVMAQLVEENQEIKSHLMRLTNALAIQEKGKTTSQASSPKKDIKWHKPQGPPLKSSKRLMP